MAEYISKQAVIDRLQNLAYDDWNQGVTTSWANAYAECADIISDFPAVDAVEAVRCKDCKWFNDWGCAIRIIDDTDKPKETDFCSFAERRKDG